MELEGVIDSIDSELFRAESRTEVEELLKQRAKLLNDSGIKAYDAVDTKDLASWEPAKIAAISYLGLLPLLRKMLFKGVRNDFRKLEDKGLRVHWIVPEYDSFVILKDIQDVYKLPMDELVERVNIVFLERSSHAGWATLPKQLAEAVQYTLTS